MLMKENTGLIVVDIQGKLARLVHESSDLISNCAKLIKGAQTLDLPIIWLEQNPAKLGATVEELNTLLSTEASNSINSHQAITKYTFDGCEEANFIKAVQTADVDNWLVCGIETHICVYQTAINLKRKGYSVHLVTDCVSSRSLDNKQLAINKLASNGIALTGLEMCLFELVKDCRVMAFKEILTLIK